MTFAQRHEKAMDLAAEAFRLLESDEEKARELFKEAFQIEKDIASVIAPVKQNEPSRSIFYKSAASLALNANLFSEAKAMVKNGFRGYPPESVAKELTDLFVAVLLQETHHRS